MIRAFTAQKLEQLFIVENPLRLSYQSNGLSSHFNEEASNNATYLEQLGKHLRIALAFKGTLH